MVFYYMPCVLWLVRSFPSTRLNVIESKERLKNNRPIKKKTLRVDPQWLQRASTSWLYAPGVIRKANVSSEKDAF